MRLTAVCVAVLAVLGACKQQPLVNSEAGLVRVRDCKGPARSLDVALATTPPTRTRPTYSQEHYADIAARLPGGFAGLYQDGDRLIILLTRVEESGAAKAAIARELPSYPVKSAQPRPARWDFAQLLDWWNYLMPKAWAAGVSSGGISIMLNRVRFGVLADSTRRKVARELDALDIPCDLVVIEIHGPITRARNAAR